MKFIFTFFDNRMKNVYH